MARHAIATVASRSIRGCIVFAAVQLNRFWVVQHLAVEIARQLLAAEGAQLCRFVWGGRRHEDLWLRPPAGPTHPRCGASGDLGMTTNLFLHVSHCVLPPVEGPIR